MKKMLTAGFTLIEVLVVIAIIGILSTIVLTLLSSAKTSSSDAAIKTDLHAVQTQADLYYYGVGAYTYGDAGTTLNCDGAGAGSMFVGDTILAQQLAAAKKESGGLSACKSVGNKYAVAVQLKSDPALAWCVDSSGQPKTKGTAGGASLDAAGIQAFVTTGKCS